MDILTRLKDIEIKLKALQTKSEDLRSQNRDLREKNSELTGLLEAQKEQIINLEEQNKITKLAGGLTSDQPDEMLKDQIDGLIKEIDRCIKLVKR